ncbi:hypothetical protein PENSPDRAFT_62809 [Peniophora sp. CONT]|nr:hypothetical protein PENSPDRAFT_62809 [Peniophora sp. CONT]
MKFRQLSGSIPPAVSLPLPSPSSCFYLYGETCPSFMLSQYLHRKPERRTSSVAYPKLMTSFANITPRGKFDMSFFLPPGTFISLRPRGCPLHGSVPTRLDLLPIPVLSLVTVQVLFQPNAVKVRRPLPLRRKERPGQTYHRSSIPSLLCRMLLWLVNPILALSYRTLFTTRCALDNSTGS